MNLCIEPAVLDPARAADPPAPRAAYLHRFAAPAARARMRLFLFPYAGASATVYREWPAAFDARCELVALQLPGRGSRLAEPAHVDHRILVEEVADAVRDGAQDAPFAFFGHSMGALLAHRVACEFARRGLPQPQCLFLSGRKAPHLPVARTPVAHMSDDDFVAELRRLDGTPPALLENAELMRLLLPTVRADFTLLDRWHRDAPERPPAAALTVPIHALAGRADPHCTPAEAAQWRHYTRGPFEALTYDGGHFFVHGDRRRLVADVRARLDPLLAAA